MMETVMMALSVLELALKENALTLMNAQIQGSFQSVKISVVWIQPVLITLEIIPVRVILGKKTGFRLDLKKYYLIIIGK